MASQEETGAGNLVAAIGTAVALAGGAFTLFGFISGDATEFLLKHSLIIVLVAVALALTLSLKIASPWQRAIVLRLGRMHAVRGEGLFLIIPFIDRIAQWVDTRIATTPVETEQTLTKDMTPVTVAAVVFWMVHDPKRATLEVEDYKDAVELVSETSLREAIGASDLTTLLSDREHINEFLKNAIGQKTMDWGVTVTAVEVREVVLPEGLQNAMSAQAQAMREKEARIIRASAEIATAAQFAEAAKIYKESPGAMDILQINRLYDMSKSAGTLILMPTDMVGAVSNTALSAAVARTPLAAPAA